MQKIDEVKNLRLNIM